MKKFLLTLTVVMTSALAHAKTLVVYYSFTNNVHTIITDLRTQIEADVIRIEPAEKGLDYAADNYAIGSAQIQAIRNHPDLASSYPAIDPVEVNLEDYDMVIIAAPLWWSNMAAPLQTFLFNYGRQMSGKNIGLIVSSASSGISGVVADAKRLIPDGHFLEPSLWIRSSQTSRCHPLLSQWLKDIDYESMVSTIATVSDYGTTELACEPGVVRVIGKFKRLTLFDLSGTKIMETTDEQISTASLLTGTYIAQIDTKQGERINRKIAVTH